MTLLKLGFVDTIPGVVNFFTTVLSKRYTVVRDDQNPDYLIFGDRNFGNNNIHYNDKNCIKIFYTGENQRPWDYQCHYALSFDHIDNEYQYRFPLYVIYDYEHNLIKNRNRDEDDLSERKGFCSFVVRNGSSEKRNQFFNKLSSYKTISSGGPHMNNIGGLIENTVPAKIEFLSKFKFNLCFENTSYPGYATEKLMEALCSKTIPIYWGSPTAAMDFNPKAFLNWHDYRNDDEFVKAIIELDNNPKLYRDMYMEPMFVNNEPTKYFNMDNFLRWFDTNVYKGVLNG